MLLSFRRLLGEGIFDFSLTVILLAGCRSDFLAMAVLLENGMKNRKNQPKI
jgi:hypothetical protein